MLRKFAVSAGVIATVLTSTAAAPAAAVAQSRYDRSVSSRQAYARHHYYARCRHERRSAGNKGTVAGALVGGASGALIGGNLLGGLVGAGVGAVAGHAIAKGRTHC